jgi:hypothetical protein
MLKAVFTQNYAPRLELEALQAVRSSNDAAVVSDHQIAVERLFYPLKAFTAQGTGHPRTSALVEIVDVGAAAAFGIAIGEERLDCVVRDRALLQAGLSMGGKHSIYPFMVGDSGYEA